VNGRRRTAYAGLLLVAGCSSARPAATDQSPAPARVSVAFDNAPPLAAEVAATPTDRQRGLMGRRELAPGAGMLFVFPGQSSGGFWMKNTLIPLSIAYVDGDRVVSTAEMTPCPPTASTCPTYPAAGPYTAAVEAVAGFFPRYGVGPGTRMQTGGTIPTPH
jgi:uncharacterized membrane protein (UPF0127 family)